MSPRLHDKARRKVRIRCQVMPKAVDDALPKCGAAGRAPVPNTSIHHGTKRRHWVKLAHLSAILYLDIAGQRELVNQAT